jgi:hypothetical protein
VIVDVLGRQARPELAGLVPLDFLRSDLIEAHPTEGRDQVLLE